MFVKEGWSSPYSFLRRFCKIEQERGTDPLAFVQHAELALAALLKSARYGGILLHNGDVVSVDDAFLSRVTKSTPFEHKYFDLTTGEVGRVPPKWVQNGTKLWRHIFSKQMIIFFAAMNAVCASLCLLAIYILSILYQIEFLPMLKYLIQEDIFSYIIASAVVSIFTLNIIFFFAVFILDCQKRRTARLSCKAYAGGHLILPDQVFDEFVRNYYPPKSEADAVGGRPRHPAYEWYSQRGFSRKQLGMSMKELQAQMPKDGNGNPPSETTIREWEREHLQRKPSSET